MKQLQKAAQFMRAMRREHDRAAYKSMRDWPQDLRVNAASVRLAHALHDARCEAFLPSMMSFAQLPMHIRRAYIDTAAAILKATKPDAGLPEDVQIAPLLARQQMRVVR